MSGRAVILAGLVLEVLAAVAARLVAERRRARARARIARGMGGL